MRKLLNLVAVATLLASLGLAPAAGAAVVEWDGTLLVNAGTFPQFIHMGTGVATVNGSAGGIGHISTISVHHGLTSGGNQPETIPLTDPANPTLTTLRATGLRLGHTVYSMPAVLNGISGGPPLGTKNTGRPPGQMKMCILFPGCLNYLPIPFGTDEDNAMGVGGFYTVNGFSKGNGFKMSVWGTAWTIGLASIQNVTTETPNGAFTSYTKTIRGFAHGPGSNTSNTASISGMLQMVTPILVQTSMDPPDTWQAWWFQVTLHFIPEPGMLLLLSWGVAGLLLLGRSRLRKL